MILLKGIYDSSSRRLMIEYKNNLLESHFDLLRSFIEEGMESEQLPKGVELSSINSTKCLITVPVDIKNTTRMKDGDRIDPGLLPQGLTEKLSETIDNFRKQARKQEFEKTEFIPLQGYPLEDLQEDVKNALRAKRDFCVVDKYSSYKSFSLGSITKMKQCRLKYLDDDYCDAVLFIYEGNIKSLQSMMKNRLEEKEWE